MSEDRPHPPLSARAARVLGQLGTAGEPVTVVFVGHTSPVHGRVTFAHGGRAAVVVDGPPVAADHEGGRVVLTAMSRGTAVALSGTVREVGQNSLSLDFFGDLRGSDPRRGPRTTVLHSVRVQVRLPAGDPAEATVAAGVAVLDHSPHGLGLRDDGSLAGLSVGARVAVVADGFDPRTAEVRHRTPTVGAPDTVRVGLALEQPLEPHHQSFLAATDEAR